MKIITRHSRAAEAIEKWERTYGSKGAWGQDKTAILNALKALPEPVDPDEVDRIIGNTTWTRTHSCSSCAARPEVVIEVGEDPDYESATAWLCLACVGKAAQLAATLFE